MDQTISVKMSDELAEEIEEYQEEDESRSAAVRRLVRAGLDVEQGADPDAISAALIMSGTTVLIMALGGALSLLAAVLGAVVLLVGLAPRQRIRRKILDRGADE